MIRRFSSLGSFFDLKGNTQKSIPKGFSVDFYNKHTNALQSVQEGNITTHLIVDMGLSIKTSTDASTFQGFLADWNKKYIQIPRQECIQITEHLSSLGLYSETLDALYDYRKYGLIPSKKTMEDIMTHYHTECMQGQKESLRPMYQCFALLLKYDIPPTATHYKLLREASEKVGETWMVESIDNELECLGWS